MVHESIRQAFAHHLWANLVIIDTVSQLSGADLRVVEDGTYGSIIGTLRHMIGADVFYLNILTNDYSPQFDEESDLAALRAAVLALGERWRDFVSDDLDDRVVIEEHETDGFRRWAPVSLRLVQAIHHGTDHRSQICTALTRLGAVPPAIDVWAFGISQGSIVEIEPSGERGRET